MHDGAGLKTGLVRLLNDEAVSLHASSLSTDAGASSLHSHAGAWEQSIAEWLSKNLAEMALQEGINKNIQISSRLALTVLIR